MTAPKFVYLTQICVRAYPRISIKRVPQVALISVIIFLCCCSPVPSHIDHGDALTPAVFTMATADMQAATDSQLTLTRHTRDLRISTPCLNQNKRVQTQEQE